MTNGIGFTILQCTMNMTKVNLSIQSVFSVLKSVVYFSILVIFTGFAIQVSSLHASEPLVSEEHISYPPPPDDKMQFPPPVQQYIDDIEGLCDLDSIEEQVPQLKQSLEGLRRAVPFYLENYFREVDSLVLGEMYGHLFGPYMNLYWVRLNGTSRLDYLADGFLFEYRLMYNLPDGAEAKYITHDWAKKVYSGLYCYSKGLSK